MGLRINEKKAKIIKFGRGMKCKIGGKEFTGVKFFKFLGVTVSNKGERTADTEGKIAVVNMSFYANKTFINTIQYTDQTDINVCYRNYYID